MEVETTVFGVSQDRYLLQNILQGKTLSRENMLDSDHICAYIAIIL
jgi:hypothetical protein